jgi:hypothetical protein
VNTILAARIKRKLQKELLKRKLVEYFVSKGYENFEMPLYPPSCYDLPVKIPQLYTRCEIIPTVEETDTTLGTVKLNWKLFVLGTNRQDLGITTHAGQTDIVRAVMGEPNMELPTEHVTTPKNVCEFVLKVLDNSKSGFIELPPNFQVPPGALTLPLMSQSRSPRLNPSASGSFYSRAR